MTRIFVILNAFFYLTGCSMIGIRNEETPKYSVILKKDSMEIRQYNSYIIATTYVDGSFREAQSKGFRILAGYIFGDNEKQSKISMTAPVVMNPEKIESEKIAMTAPVTQTPQGNGWEMSFMMPSKFKNIEDLPRPKNSQVILKVVEPKSIAVITFTGLWSENKNQIMADELKKWISQQGEYTPLSEPQFAGYDPPWTLPFLRRNEIMIEVQKR